MNRRLLWTLLVVALAGIAGSVYLLVARRAPSSPEYVEPDVIPPIEEPANAGARSEFEDVPTGGTYAGRIVEADGGAPIPYAQVLLVATKERDEVLVESLTADGEGERQSVPVFGSYQVIARDTSDAHGGFRLSAGSDRPVAIVAAEPGHGPAMLAHLRSAPLKPGPDHVLRLARAGVFEGTVVDKVSRAPVPGADVEIYLQHPANQDERGTIPFTPEISWGRFQQLVTTVLGPLIWGIEPRGNDAALHLTTDRDGRFTLRPVMTTVQLEVVVSHPDYMWLDFDETVALERDNPTTAAPGKVLKRKRRVVVPAGQTVARTYEMERGKSIAGTVTDEKSVPFADVEVRLQHVVQSPQHHYYRSRARVARTDAAGRFTLAGLSDGNYVLQMLHPAFGSKYFQPVKEASDETYRISRGGWIDGTVAGGSPDRTSFVADVRLVRTSAGEAVMRREKITVRDGRFELDKVEPGTYDLTLASGTFTAAPARVTVAPGEAATVAVELRPGGSFRLSITGSSGAAIDPASAEMEFLGDEGPPRRVGNVISRRGVVEAEGLTAGRYRVVVHAAGYGETATEPFEVVAERMTPVPTVVLLRSGFVRIASLNDFDGRPPADGVVRDIEIVKSDGTKVPPARFGAAIPIAVPPGPTTIRATTTDGRVFESKPDVAEGATVAVDVVLPRP